MNEKRSQKNLEAITWGAIFVWWGIMELIPGLPRGSGPLGFGLILLGLNGYRLSQGLPTNAFSTTIGILALVWGGLDLAGAFLNLPFEIPVFAILLIVLGGIVLAGEFKQNRKDESGGLK